MPRREFLAATAAATGLAALAGCRTEVDPDPGFEVVALKDVMIPMRDGVKLATDIYLPARDGEAASGKFPVILERTPYNKTAPSRSERTADDATPLGRAEVAEFFVQRGYVVIYQDTRGRYRSEGEFVKYLSDGDDGFDTCAWILQQPWCSGRIGTKGLSYAAHTQGALGSAGAPGVVAMWLDSGGFSNSYQGGIRQGGAFELKQATWAFTNALQSPEVTGNAEVLAAMQAIDIKEWFARLPWQRGASPVTLAPEYEDYLFEQWEHGTFDEYWKQPGIYAAGFYEQFPDAAMMHMSSWYDPYPRTATDNYLGLKALKRGPVRLLLGPWTHGDRQLTYAGNVDFGSAATVDGNVAPDYLTLRLQWFDRWLRGIRNGVDQEPAVRLFVMGGGSGRKNAAGRLEHGGAWRSESEWPLPGTRWEPWYLHADGSLAPIAPETASGFLEYAHDPRNPVPTIGGAVTSGRPVMEGGAYDQRESAEFFGSTVPGRALADRPDVLAFESEPLAEAVELTGPLTVTLWIASDAPDTDFTAKLVDVYPPSADYPDGYAMNLTDGILRVRYRESWEVPTLMTPGQIYEVTIEAFPTSNRFMPGHRIRLDIASSNFPHFDVNPNTGEPEGRATTMRVARNRVYLDRERPSHAILPVIPRRD